MQQDKQVSDQDALGKARKTQVRLRHAFHAALAVGTLSLLCALPLMMASSMNVSGVVDGKKFEHKAENARPYYYLALGLGAILSVGGAVGYTRSSIKLQEIDEQLKQQKQNAPESAKPQ